MIPSSARSLTSRRFRLVSLLPAIVAGSLAYFLFLSGRQAYLNARLVDAVRENDADAVECLLQAGADPNTRAHLTQTGRSLKTRLRALFGPERHVLRDPQEWYNVLMLAARGSPRLHQSFDIVNHLYPEKTPQAYAVLKLEMERNTRIVRALIDHGADVNAQTGLGCTALFLARRTGTGDVATLLKQAGAREVRF